MTQSEEVLESAFLQHARKALERLFTLAREKDELNFALSLSTEFKPYTYTSAMEAQRAFKEYEEFLSLPEFYRKNIRLLVILSFYCYVAEAAGLWCIPMCMLQVLAGKTYSLDPFRNLVAKHKGTGKNIAPNANKVMGALAREAEALGLKDVCEVFTNAFDGDLRNGVAHADYVLNEEGIHVRGRHDRARLITWPDLPTMLNNGINLYHVLRDVVGSFEHVYETPKVVTGSINDKDPPGCYMIDCDVDTGMLTVSAGIGITAEDLLQKFRDKRAV
jgi:hypothetical protein